MIAELLGKKVLKLHIPLSIGALPLQILAKTGIKLPIKAEQILRLNEDKAFAHYEASNDFGYKPTALAVALNEEIIDILREAERTAQ
jgi:hypothetical protein